MKPSMLAAIAGEAYCSIFNMSAWWSKRVAGAEVAVALVFVFAVDVDDDVADFLVDLRAVAPLAPRSPNEFVL